MPERIRVGVSILPQHSDYERLRRAWIDADELGVDAIFAWDHFYPLSGDPEGKHFECFSLLAAMVLAAGNIARGINARAVLFFAVWRLPYYPFGRGASGGKPRPENARVWSIATLP